GDGLGLSCGCEDDPADSTAPNDATPMKRARNNRMAGEDRLTEGVVIESVRCGFPGRSLLGKGRKLPSGPHGAVDKVFLVPDGDRLLQGVDRVTASIESRSPVGRANRYKHAGFTNLQAAQAVDQGDVIDGIACMKLLSDLPHLGQGHRLVGFVFEVQRRAAMRVVADTTIEGSNGAV